MKGYTEAEQLTKEQAIAFYESRAWEGWTAEQKTGFQLFQNRLCMPFTVFHEAIEETLGRPVFTHEFGLNKEGLENEYLGLAPTPTIEQVIDLIPSEKCILIFGDRP